MADKPLLIDAQELAKMLAVSRTTLRRMVQESKLPDPVSCFEHPRWSRAVIEQWVLDGCPDRTRIFIPN